VPRLLASPCVARLPVCFVCVCLLCVVRRGLAGVCRRCGGAELSRCRQHAPRAHMGGTGRPFRVLRSAGEFETQWKTGKNRRDPVGKGKGRGKEKGKGRRGRHRLEGRQAGNTDTSAPRAVQAVWGLACCLPRACVPVTDGPISCVRCCERQTSRHPACGLGGTGETTRRGSDQRPRSKPDAGRVLCGSVPFGGFCRRAVLCTGGRARQEGPALKLSSILTRCLEVPSAPFPRPLCALSRLSQCLSLSGRQHELRHEQQIRQ
jgi:hypothetical protein